MDWFEEENGQLKTVEFNWNPAAKAKFPNSFQEAYPEAELTVVSPENYMGWLASN